MKFKKIIINLIIFILVCTITKFSLATEANEIEEPSVVPQEEQQQEQEPKQEEIQEEPKQEEQQEPEQKQEPQQKPEPKQEEVQEEPKQESHSENYYQNERSNNTNYITENTETKSSNANLASMSIGVRIFIS